MNQFIEHDPYKDFLDQAVKGGHEVQSQVEVENFRVKVVIPHFKVVFLTGSNPDQARAVRKVYPDYKIFGFVAE